MTVRTQLDSERERFVAAEPLVLPPTVGSAARHHPFLVVLPVILLIGIAVAAAHERSPTYTAQTRLVVGRVDGSTPANLAGFVSASQALAETYSRTVRGDAVVGEVARELGISAAAIRSHVSAATIPQTAVFRVTATGPSRERAVILANVVSDSLVAHAARESTSTPRSAGLRRAYRRASAVLEEHRAEVERARSRYAGAATPTNRAQLGNARADAAAVELRVRALEADYAASRQTQGSVARVQVLEHATGASSDRYSAMQLLGFVAAVAGVTMGLGLALLREKRVVRRMVG